MQSSGASDFYCQPPQPLADFKNRNRLHRILNGCPSRAHSHPGARVTGSHSSPRPRPRLPHHWAHPASDSESQQPMKMAAATPTLKHSVSTDTNLSSGVEDTPATSTGFLTPKTKVTARKPHNEKVNGAGVTTNGTYDDLVSSEPYPPLKLDYTADDHENSGWRAVGVRFAPFKIPLKRRLQTAAVLFHCMGIVVFLSIFWFTCANPLSWPFLIPYLIYLTFSSAPTDGKLARRSERIRNLRLWKLFAGYFPLRLHKTADLDPSRRYIMGYHPHGIISHGAWASFATNALGFNEKFPGITNSLLTLDSNFRLPFFRDWILSMGISSVSKESIRNLLSRGGPANDGKGRAVTIVIGGARESLEAEPGHLRLILKNRKGFVKMALRSGADLVPVMGFGENDIYDQLSARTHPGVHRLQMFCLKVFKFTLPAMHGRGLLNYDVGLMPYRRPVNVVIGRPIRVHTQPGHQPTQQEIDRYHEAYVQELEKLWNSYKDVFAAGRVSELEFKEE